jgi:phosphatidate cytidylyltransferase
LGVPYLGLACVALVWLREATGAGRANVITLLLIVWASDIGAYVAGRAVGGPKLAPRISPGKTVSGAIGGLLAAMAVGVFAALHTGINPPWRSALLAMLVGCIAQAGDLFESALKRRFGVKDSGRLIPGHGGALDRLDALIAAAPFAALLALILGGGVVIW